MRVGPVSSMVLGWRRDYSLIVLVLLGCPFPHPLARESTPLELFLYMPVGVSRLPASSAEVGIYEGGRETKQNFRELTIKLFLGCQSP